MKFSSALPAFALSLICASASCQAVNGSGSVNQVPKFSGASTVTGSAITEVNGSVGVGTANPNFAVDVNGDVNISGYAYRFNGSPIFRGPINGNSYFFGNSGSSSPTGTGNLGFGLNALLSLTDGNYDVGIGQNALNANTDGQHDVAVGVFTLSSNTTGVYNTAVGSFGLYSNISGSGNTSVGMSSLENASSGSGETAVGLNSLSSLQTGDANDAFGGNALTGLASGTDNVAVGDGAGDDVSGGGQNTAATQNTYLGASTQSQQSGDNNEVVIGAYAVGNGSNSVTLGNTTVVSTVLRGNIVLSNGGVSSSIGASVTFPDSTVQNTAWNGTTNGGDYAESIEVLGRTDSYEPGDVIAINPEHPGDFTKASTPYSRLVAGVYSTKPGLTGRRLPLEQPKTSEIPMALVGIVPTKVSDENGPIRPGDLLVGSSTPGYAMRGTDSTQLTGAVIGKSLGTLKVGSGVIEVLVALQ